MEARSVDQSTVGPRGNVGADLAGAVLSRATPPSTYRARAAPVDRAMDPLDVCRTFRTDGHAAALPVSPRVQVTGIMRTPSQARVTLTGGEATGRLAGIRVPLTKVIR